MMKELTEKIILLIKELFNNFVIIGKSHKSLYNFIWGLGFGVWGLGFGVWGLG